MLGRLHGFNLADRDCAKICLIGLLRISESEEIGSGGGYLTLVGEALQVGHLKVPESGLDANSARLEG